MTDHLKNFHRWTRRHFYVMDGPPKAYFELRSCGGPDVNRVVYQTIRFKTKGPGSRKRLVAHLKRTIGEAIRVDGEGYKMLDHLLFWRLRPRISFNYINGWTVLRTRLAVPHYHFSVAPEGVEADEIVTP